MCPLLYRLQIYGSLKKNLFNQQYYREYTSKKINRIFCSFTDYSAPLEIAGLQENIHLSISNNHIVHLYVIPFEWKK